MPPRLALLALVLLALFASAPAGAGFGYSPTQNSPFTPAAFTPVAWYQHGIGITTVAGAVSVWTDSSGTGDTHKNLTNGTAGKRPAYTAIDSNFGGQPSLAFLNASDSYLASGTWTTPLAQPFTIVWIGDDSLVTTTTFVWDDLGTLEQTSLFMQSTPTATLLNHQAGIVSNFPQAIASPCIVIAIYNGSQSALYFNGLPVAAGQPAAVPKGLDGFVLGSLGGADLGVDAQQGSTAEALILGIAVDPLQVSAIDTYYSRIFGIAVQ